MNDLIKGRVWPWEKADLIARLLAEETDLTDCAADRIERTEERNKELTLQLLATSGQAADALDKLAKAVLALRYISTEVSIPVKTKKHGGIKFKWMYFSWREVAVKRIDIARAALAELEGMK
jgi:hypothetical protein